MTPDEVHAIEANLFHVVRGIVRAEPKFPWHRNRQGVITACQVNSSQALAVDVFGTIQRIGSCDVIVDAWMRALELPRSKMWTIELEKLVPQATLGEPRPTQIDAFAKGNAGIVLFECKFTEPDGGPCSAAQPLRSGSHAGVIQCNGDYADQVNPVNNLRSSCALTSKGIRYWEYVDDVMGIDPHIEHHPCPFKGGWYQWMRNLVAAAALGRQEGVPASFVVIFTEGPFAMAQKVAGEEWLRLAHAVSGRSVPLRAASYQHLLTLAVKVAMPNDRVVLAELQEWIARKVLEASR